MNEILSILIIFISSFFVISGMPKLVNIKASVALTIDYNLLPKKIASVFGVILPFAEITLGITLFFNEFRLHACIGLLLLLFCFYVAVKHVMNTGKELSCGCYGKLIDSKVDKFTVFKILLLGIVISIITLTTVLSEITTQIDIGGVTVIGISLSVTLFLFQYLWTTNKNSREILRKMS